MCTARAVLPFTRRSLKPQNPAAALICRYFASNGREQETSWREKEKHLKPDPPDTITANKGELGVGEMDGGKFKIEPLRRTGEDVVTMRARLLCMYYLVLCKDLLTANRPIP
jgi:hypothetical protein